MKKLISPFITLLFISITHAQVNPPSVKIGSQIWMVKNLDVSTYRNGDLIPEVKDSATWANLATGAWCNYDNDSANGKIYGKLYNWYAVNDPRGLAPAGWHIPSDTEWTKLTNFLGGEDSASIKMKSANGCNILPRNGNGTNESGFEGIPGGYRGYLSGAFESIGYNRAWWSSTEYNLSGAWWRGLSCNDNKIHRSNLYGYKKNGLSVRCVKD